MNYDFPQIKHIGDILPHIQGRDEFLVMEKEWYVVINYAVAFEETFQWDHTDPVGSAIRRECRGLIFDGESGNLISRSYHKFFNAGERDETQIDKINLYEPHVVLEKLDGSMIRPIPTKKGFRLATKAGVTEVAMNAEVFIADKSNYCNFINLCISQETTPIFEWCSRKNRIVIDYPEDQLILTSIRCNNTGSYVEYESVKRSASLLNIPIVKSVNRLAKQNIHLFVDQVREWDDGEGVVIRFNSGHMVKVKSDDYVLRHRVISSFTQEKSILSIIIEDRIDDVIPLLYPKDAERLQNFYDKFWHQISVLENQMIELYNQGDSNYPDRKDFAVEYVQKQVDKKYIPIMFGMKSGKTAKQIILSMIEKSLSTSTKIDANRWLFGNLNWNDVTP